MQGVDTFVSSVDFKEIDGFCSTFVDRFTEMFVFVKSKNTRIRGKTDDSNSEYSEHS